MSSVRAIVEVVLTAWLLPLLAVAGFAREMERRETGVTNYRGRRVFLGLGLAWLVAAIGSILASRAGWLIGGWGIILLVPGAFAFGLLDDALGSGEDRGFRGHLRAVRHGRLTTGMLKMVGISALALSASPVVHTRWYDGYGQAEKAAAVLCGAAVIALTANLVNLVDLRPARALKVYALLGVPAAAAAGAVGAYPWPPLLSAVAGVLLVLGPAVAVWRYDAGERGMLGDAGANAAGALAGYFAALALPMPWLALWAAVLLGVNLLSERVSFSSAIERTPLLHRLDLLGRPRDVSDAIGAETAPE